jgi:hypothetical protein
MLKKLLLNSQRNKSRDIKFVYLCAYKEKSEVLGYLVLHTSMFPAIMCLIKQRWAIAAVWLEERYKMSTQEDKVLSKVKKLTNRVVIAFFLSFA